MGVRGAGFLETANPEACIALGLAVQAGVLTGQVRSVSPQGPRGSISNSARGAA